MTASAAFRQVLIGKLTGPEAQRKVAAIARGFRAEVIASGRAAGGYTTTVDGVEGAAEETVRTDGGVIIYRFNGLAAAVEFALDYVRTRSPSLGPARGGHFVNSWTVWVDGALFNGSPRDIKSGGEVFIVNTQPYSRKIDMGANTTGERAILSRARSRKGRSSARRALRMISITEGARQAMMPRFPGLRIERDMLTLPAPFDYMVKSTGQRMTFPAIVLNWADGYSLQSSSERTLRQVNGQGVRRKRGS